MLVAAPCTMKRPSPKAPTRETVDLHPELRALVDEVLSTSYLSEAEAAYQRGEIADYFLFPTGKRARGEGGGGAPQHAGVSYGGGPKEAA